MKSAVLAQILFLWLFVLILLQPMLSHQDYMLNVAVKANADYAAEKAAPYGHVTPELRQEILDNLRGIGFDPSQIMIESQVIQQERGERIDVIIRAPRMPMFLYRIGNSQLPREYFAHSYTTSEFLS